MIAAMATTIASAFTLTDAGRARRDVDREPVVLVM
jgi:hypothetical protein